MLAITIAPVTPPECRRRERRSQEDRKVSSWKWAPQTSKHPLRSWNSLHCRTFNISNWSTQSYINLQLSLSDVDKIGADLTDERWSCKISCIQSRGQTCRHLGSISRFFNWLTLLMMKNWSKTSQQDNLWKRYVEMKQKAFVIFLFKNIICFLFFKPSSGASSIYDGVFPRFH